jgi:hypothetical protein
MLARCEPLWPAARKVADSRATLSPMRIDRTIDKAARAELPAPIGHTVSMAPSDGKACDGCDERIALGEQVYFVNLQNALLLRFHDACYTAWFAFAPLPLASGLLRTLKGVAQMPDEGVLREKARMAVQTGKLPARRPDRVWGGPGVDAACEVCGLPVKRDEMAFEIQFARDGDGGGDLDKFHVHIRCFAAWEFERRRASQ